jgi:hypothetical protein
VGTRSLLVKGWHGCIQHNQRQGRNGCNESSIPGAMEASSVSCSRRMVLRVEEG